VGAGGEILRGGRPIALSVPQIDRQALALVIAETERASVYRVLEVPD
jgi:hypothetical protein